MLAFSCREIPLGACLELPPGHNVEPEQEEARVDVLVHIFVVHMVCYVVYTLHIKYATWYHSAYGANMIYYTVCRELPSSHDVELREEERGVIVAVQQAVSRPHLREHVGTCARVLRSGFWPGGCRSCFNLSI